MKCEDYFLPFFFAAFLAAFFFAAFLATVSSSLESQTEQPFCRRNRANEQEQKQVAPTEFFRPVNHDRPTVNPDEHFRTRNELNFFVQSPVIIFTRRGFTRFMRSW
jgi:hypothetical protein